jgi:hypothetical protein
MKPKIAMAITTFFSSLSIFAAILLPFIEAIKVFLGSYIVILQVPLIVGGLFGFLGAFLIPRKIEVARTLIFIGGCVGILNIGSLFALILLKENQKHDDFRRLWILPVLCSYLMLAIYIIDTPDQQWIPINWRGRNGLTLAQTIWDTDVFWGTLWFNLLVAFLFSLLLLWRFPSSVSAPWVKGQFSESKLAIIFGCVAGTIMLAMAITWNRSFSIWSNWYETQFAYQITAWPALLGIMVLMVSRMKNVPIAAIHRLRFDRGVLWIYFLLFAAIWIFLSAITNFHPHVIFGLGQSLYTLIMTWAFPVCITLFIFQTRKNKIRNLESNTISTSNNNGSGENLSPPIENVAQTASKLGSIVGFFIFLQGLGLLALLQYIGSETVPLAGSETMFSFGLEWSWPLAHWPSYLFISSLTGFLVCGTRTWMTKYQKKYVNNPAREKVQKEETRSKPSTVLAALCVAALVITPIFILQFQWTQFNQPLLLVNQVGYLPNAPKRIIFQAPEGTQLPDSATFEIIDKTTRKAVFTGILTKDVERYGYVYMVGKFSDWTTVGRYYASTIINNKEYVSYPFLIGNDVYDAVLESQLRFFYYQRCGYEVEEVVEGYPGHHACHTNDAEVWDGEKWVQIDLTGGWHDAGDYNKYNSWFQTQWYCAQALAEAVIIDPDNAYSTVDSIYDSAMPDALDEALWGGKFLMNCINDEGLQGEDKRYLVWETVSGYRHYEDREARMSYWGPAEMDWTTPRRVVFNEWNSTFCGYHRGYGVAATLLHLARLIDSQRIRYPGYDIPAWAVSMDNTTYVRELAQKIYDKYTTVQGTTEDDVQSYIGKLYYAEEIAILNGMNWVDFDTLVLESLDTIPSMGSWPYWFGWAGYYYFGNILTHYRTYGRPVPTEVQAKIQTVQGNHFTELFEGPFLLKHGILDGQKVLWFGMERMTDMMTSAWLQGLISCTNESIAKLEIVQAILDYIMGVNPFAICLIESLGSYNFAQYHHRYSYAENPRGAVPGAIPNGIALYRPSKDYCDRRGLEYKDEVFVKEFGDRPMIATWPANPLYRDGVPSNPNEVWIPHNAMMIRILTMMRMNGVIY